MIQQHQISSYRADAGSNAPSGSVLAANGAGGMGFSSVTRMAIGRVSDSPINLSNTTYNFVPSTYLASNVSELNMALSNLRLVNNSGATRWYLFEFWPQFSALGSASWGRIDYAPTNYSGTFVNWAVAPSTVIPTGSSYAMYYAPYAWAYFGVSTGNTVEVRLQLTVTTGSTTTLSSNSLWKLYSF